MRDDIQVRERLSALWHELPVGEPDLERIRRKGGRRRARRAIGTVIASSILLAALVLPIWALVGVDGGSEPSPGGGGEPSIDAADAAWVDVDAVEALRDPQTVIDGLRGAGIEATIVQVPLDPEGEGKGQLGQWNAVTFERADAVANADYMALRDKRAPDRQRLQLPPSIAGAVTLYVNRAALPGETPWFFGYGMGVNELSPTGTLWCLGLEAMTPKEATSALQRRGYEVSWLRVDEELGMFPVDELPTDGELVFSFLRSPGVVDLRFADARNADAARQAFGTPSKRYPRSTWSDWATCD